ncbi:galactose mutarotase-like domain-containing protein [Mrakia frigida]|uniref:D-hexose-6-phosphate mutarotase n=1 Tax=Mrakia frigida TaxID=29902 RepID=UPI003FCC1037
MPVTKDSKKVYLTHASGSSAEVYLYGATVTSFKAASSEGGKVEERLFVSDTAILDGSKAIRGGIPVVFPIFGPPPTDATAFPYHSKLSQHGFARTSIWTLNSEFETSDGGVVVELVLNPTPEITSAFPPPFALSYTLTLTSTTFTASLKITNPGSAALQFQTLLHTYLSTPSHLDALVYPLKGLSYKDKTRGGNTFVEDREKVDVKEETDRVYAGVGPEGKLTLEYGGKEKGGVEVEIGGFVDATIWNPGEKTGSAMGDMHAKGWESFVCVEPGYVSEFYSLEAGKEWVGKMVLKVF